MLRASRSLGSVFRHGRGAAGSFDAAAGGGGASIIATRAIVTLAALYVLLFGALGTEISFLPYLLALKGLSAAEIGLVLAIGTVVQIVVAPLLGLAADRLGIRIVLGLSAGAAAASFLLFFFPTSAVQALFVYAIFAAAVAPLNPLADALSVPACLQAAIPYGRIRGIGSIGFLLGVVLSSAITSRFGVGGIVPMTAVAFGLVAVTVALVKPVSPPSRETSLTFSTGIGTVRSLLTIAHFRRILLVATLILGSHAMSDAFAVIHWTAIGIGAPTVGLLLAAAVGSEIIAFVGVGPMLLSRLGPSTCVAIGAGAGVLRWTILAEVQSVWLLLGAQLMHGLTFSLVHLALMQVLARVAPQRFFATAQTLYGICGNAIASGVITLVAGAMFSKLEAQAFLLPAVLCGLAFPIALRLRYRCATAPDEAPIGDHIDVI